MIFDLLHFFWNLFFLFFMSFLQIAFNQFSRIYYWVEWISEFMAAPSSYLVFQINFNFNLLVYNVKRYIYDLQCYFIMVFKLRLVDLYLNKSFFLVVLKKIFTLNQEKNFFLYFFVVLLEELFYRIFYLLTHIHFTNMLLNLFHQVSSISLNFILFLSAMLRFLLNKLFEYFLI
jgi:hypothetical protein